MQQTKGATHISITGAEEWRDGAVLTTDHYIGLMTIGVQIGLSDGDKALLIKAFNTKKVTKPGDSFYSYELHYGAETKRIFVVFNGEMGFTAMLAEEY